MRMSYLSRASPDPIASIESDTESCSIRPRRPSLDPQRELLSTRGQHLPALIRRRSFSASTPEGLDENGFRSESAASFRERVDHPPLERASALIGDSRPFYNWEEYYMPPSTLKTMSKPLRKFYERNNDLISQYAFIDRLLDSSLPRRLFVDYHHDHPGESQPMAIGNGNESERGSYGSISDSSTEHKTSTKVKRTPRNLYRIPSESSLLLPHPEEEHAPSPLNVAPKGNNFVDSGARIVTIAIYVNFIANVVLLAAKIVVMSMTSSLSVLASLVDGALDFLSTTIVWVTAVLIKRQDRYKYPISRRRLEPLSVLVFAVVMVTSFVQVAITSLGQLLSPEHSVVALTVPSAVIMAGTVVVKLACWLWCRLINNSSVQALAQDAMTDVIFNSFSILFPLIGGFTNTWWVDPLGGLFLSIYVIWNWGGTAGEHIKHLTGAAASPVDHSILLYMTMRFSKLILNIQNLRAYYSGDLLNVEVDIILEGKTSLRDSHDLGESLQYMVESVPTVERAFVHLDYDPWNIPTHLNQQES